MRGLLQFISYSKLHNQNYIDILGAPIMFGANPIPEPELNNSNSTNATMGSEMISASNTYHGNHSEASEANYMKFTSSKSMLSPTTSSLLGNINSTVANNLYQPGSSISTSENEFVCAFYNPEYIIYSSLCSFFIPCVFMVFLYSRIFWVSYNSCLLD